MRVKDTIRLSHCDGDETVHEGVCYKLIGVKTTWDEARHACLRRNSDLAVIGTQEKRDFIAFLIRRHLGGYVDLHLYTGEPHLVWLAGKKETRNSISYWFWSRLKSALRLKESDQSFWEPGHPDSYLTDGCMALSSETAYGAFRSVECSSMAMYICERSEPEQIRHQQSYMYQCRCMPGFSGLNCDFSVGANTFGGTSSSRFVEENDSVQKAHDVPLLCGEQPLEISCDPVGGVEMRIAIDYAFFGVFRRDNAHTTKFCPGQSKEKECFAENSLLLLSHYCHGRRKCSLPQLTRLFAGHPCLPKSYGYKMEYRYRCVGGAIRCHHRTFEHDGACLKLFLDERLKMSSWSEARKHCLSSGGDLIGPFRKDIESALFDAMALAKVDYALMWTGLRINNRSGKPSEFIWTNNIEFDDTKMEFNWQPTRSGCVAIEVSCQKHRHCSVRLIVRDCKESLRWICQYSKRALDHTSLQGTLPHDRSSSDETSDEEMRHGCAATRSRNVYWPITPVGSTARKPCPPGTTGTALWKCVNRKGKAQFVPEVPDMSGCTQLWFNHIKYDIESKVPAIEIVHSLGAKIDETKNLYGGDIKQTILTVLQLSALQYGQLSQGKTLSDEKKSLDAESFSKNATSIYNKLLDDAILPVWNDLPKEQLSRTASSMMKNLETVASHMSSFFEKEGQFTFILSNIDMKIQIRKISALSQRGRRDTAFVGEPDLATFSSSSNQAAISLPISSVQQAVSKKVQSVFTEGRPKGLPDDDTEEIDRLLFGFFVYRRGISELLKPQIDEIGISASQEMGVNETIVNSEVVSATVNAVFGSVQLTDGEPIVLTLWHLTKVNVERPRCVYWDLKANQWDTGGCRLLNTTEEYSVCACNHLTSFAIMMDVNGKWTQMPRSAHRLMNLMTVVACALSCVSLMLSLIAFSCIRALWSVRNAIHINLCLCLLVGQLLFVFGIDKTANAAACSAIAVLLHFSFLSAFCWMFAEGYQLYLMLVKVFECERSFKLFLHLLAYGVPSLVVALSASLRWPDYGTSQYCWINLSSPAMWSFVGPVVLVISVNVIVLFMALRTVLAVTIARKKSSASAVYGWLKGSAMLLCLLGVTWGIGLFIAVEPTGDVFSYIFIVLNATQGIFILVFHVLMNEKGRMKLSKVVTKHIRCFSWKSYKAFESFASLSRSKKSGGQKESSTFSSDLPVPLAKKDGKGCLKEQNIRIRNKMGADNATGVPCVSGERSA